jgi:MazG family protein
MISRHPHVFGDVDADTPADVDGIWDALKAKEKGAIKHESALDGVPKAFPALLRAQKLQKKAAKTGFEWTEITDVLDKLEEELAEMREAVAEGTIEQKADELGDLFFVLTNFGRLLGLSSEEALRDANNKFERRFNGMEGDLKKEDKVISALTLDQMTQLWIKQKQKEGS